MNPVHIADPKLRAHLDGLPPDGITIFTLENDSIRGGLLSGSRMLAEMTEAHRLGLLESYLLGQAYLAAGLLSVTIKGQDRLRLQVDASGPAGGLSVECSSADEGASVRGRLFNAPFELPEPLERLDTAPLLGDGRLSITRFQAGRTEPVQGSVGLRSGVLAEDLAYFYQTSEQLPTAFSLGIKYDQDGRLLGAGGLYLQALPNAGADALDRAERLVYSMPALGQAFAAGTSRQELAMRMFPFFDLNLLDERQVRFACPCDKQRLGSFLNALPADEKTELSLHGPFPLEIRCHNCGSVYGFSQEEVRYLCSL